MVVPLTSAWAQNMKSLLQKTCHAVSQSDDKCLTEAVYKKLRKHYRNILTRGEKEMPAMTRLDKYRVLIIDDIGYVRKTDSETQVLFEFIAHRYESGS
ncbi:MAG: ATP-binding protein, partial [Nitrosomonas sp.]|nr:ATP-binding protein [Nitrosomonas sp.]